MPFYFPVPERAGNVALVIRPMEVGVAVSSLMDTVHQVGTTPEDRALVEEAGDLIMETLV